MVIALRPNRGGFARPFGAGWFIREYLMGNGPEGSTPIDPERGAPQSDINYEYKVSLATATARTRAEKRISNLVLAGEDVTEELAEKIYQQELKKISHKFTRMRYHSFLKYFGTLKKLGWVEETSETENSAMQDHYPEASDRIYYRLTEAGRKATDAEWSNPLFTMYPEIGANHKSRNTGWPHRKVREPGT
jgi:DNA-binding PadR family transcriptional regulator